MGRLVYFSFPAHGHVNPTLPVIRELAARGEDITYFGTPRFAPAIAATGARFCPYTHRLQMPDRGAGPFAQVSTALETLLEFSATVLDEHLEAVRQFRPTHILFDSFAPWGRMVAQLLGLPGIASIPSILVNQAIDERYGSGPERPPEDPRLTAQWCSQFRARCHDRLLGYPLPKPLDPTQLLQTYGDFNLVYTSRHFQPCAESFDERRFRFVGPSFSFRPDAPPFPFERLDDRPVVFVSLGTVYGSRPEFLRRCVEELAQGPWQVVIATGGESALADALPGNCIAQVSVPQVEVLRRAAAFVTHGGMNSVQEALYYGVPLVLAPQGADQFWIARRTAELGAGLLLDSAASRPGDVCAAVSSVLAGRNYSAAAAHLAQSLHAAGGPLQAAAAIQSFFRGQFTAQPVWSDTVESNAGALG